MRKTTKVILLCVAVGILFTMGILAYLRLSDKAIESEARSNLKSLQHAMEAYHNAHGEYTKDIDALVFQRTGKNRFHYAIKLEKPDGYRIIATHKKTGERITVGAKTILPRDK